MLSQFFFTFKNFGVGQIDVEKVELLVSTCQLLVVNTMNIINVGGV